jgi:hypothetical protein
VIQRVVRDLCPTLYNVDCKAHRLYICVFILCISINFSEKGSVGFTTFSKGSMAQNSFKNPLSLGFHLLVFAMDGKWCLCEVGNEAFVSSVN